MSADPSGPFATSEPRCGAAAENRGGSGFSGCQRAVAYAGTVTYPGPPRETWRAFACDLHRDRLDDPHPLTEDDRAELDDRREQERRGRTGLSYRRPQPLRGRRRT